MSKLLLIHCGGTLAMVKGITGYTTELGNLGSLILSNRKIANEISRVHRTNYNATKPKNQLVTFITPSLKNGVFATIDVFEFPNIIDSSNVSVEHCCEISEVISDFYDDYDGFVLIHGTDTMSYAASLLGFMIEGPCIPIVFTGAVMPMVLEGSDAEANLIGAIESCLLVDTPGVYVFFNGLLHNGARITRISSLSFDGFFSTNPTSIKDLAKTSSGHGHSSRKRKRERKPRFYTKMSSDIGIFKIFPSIHPYHFESVFTCYKAVILETYGTGTFPLNRPDLLKVIEDFIADGGIVVNASQCSHGNVSGLYETNSVISRYGVLSARNMTTEAVFAKLSFLLANYPTEVNQSFPISICGEIDEESVDSKTFIFNNKRTC